VTDLPLEGLAVEQPSIDAALHRLTAALNELEAVVERRQENDRGQDNLAARIQALGADRSRLADELDHSLSRSRTLEDANRSIAERIDGAIETIRAVLKAEQQP
jgi:chromosome segregation ATPase